MQSPPGDAHPIIPFCCVAEDHQSIDAFVLGQQNWKFFFLLVPLNQKPPLDLGGAVVSTVGWLGLVGPGGNN